MISEHFWKWSLELMITLWKYIRCNDFFCFLSYRKSGSKETNCTDLRPVHIYLSWARFFYFKWLDCCLNLEGQLLKKYTVCKKVSTKTFKNRKPFELPRKLFSADKQLLSLLLQKLLVISLAFFEIWKSNL